MYLPGNLWQRTALDVFVGHLIIRVIIQIDWLLSDHWSNNLLVIRKNEIEFAHVALPQQGFQFFRLLKDQLVVELHLFLDSYSGHFDALIGLETLDDLVRDSDVTICVDANSFVPSQFLPIFVECPGSCRVFGCLKSAIPVHLSVLDFLLEIEQVVNFSCINFVRTKSQVLAQKLLVEIAVLVFLA